jgi:hypothetical protein
MIRPILHCKMITESFSTAIAPVAPQHRLQALAGCIGRVEGKDAAVLAAGCSGAAGSKNWRGECQLSGSDQHEYVYLLQCMWQLLE